MNIGDVVKHKVFDIFGTIHPSTNGCTLNTYNEETKSLNKTYGKTPDDFKEFWKTVDLPEGYTTHKYGGLIKIPKWEGGW